MEEERGNVDGEKVPHVRAVAVERGGVEVDGLLVAPRHDFAVSLLDKLLALFRILCQR